VRQLRQAYIKQSVILNYQVCHFFDKTSGGCYIPTHCPRLPANVTATLSPPPIGWMDSAIYDESGGVCVGGGGTGRCACRRAGASPSSPRSSLSHHTAPPRTAATHGGLSGAGTRTGGRATPYAAALADRRRSTAHEDDAAAVLRTVPRCN